MREDYFKDIYKDFFGVEKLNVNTTEKRSLDMSSLFDRINNLYITLNKIISYFSYRYSGMKHLLT